MKFLTAANSERTFAHIGIVLGFAASFVLAPKDEFFFPNFLFYWGSQLSVVVLILLLRPKPAVVTAMSVILVAILLGFKMWLWSRADLKPDGLVWLLYLVLLFGAAIGGLGATWWLRRKRNLTSIQLACAIGVAALCGSCLSTTWACNNGLYCH